MANFRVPVLVGGGWRDFNVKPDESINLYNALSVDDPATPEREGVPLKMLAMGQNPHGNPTITAVAGTGRPLPGTTPSRASANGINIDAPVYTATRTGTAAVTKVESSWPPPSTGEVALHLEHSGADGTLAAAPTTGAAKAFTDVSAGDDFRAMRDLSAENDWLWYASPPLTRDARLAGEAVLDATVTVRARGTLAPVLVEIPASGTPRWETFGALNLHYREGLAAAKPVAANQPVKASVVFKPQDRPSRRAAASACCACRSSTRRPTPRPCSRTRARYLTNCSVTKRFTDCS